ncbi:DMT family transporter [Oceanobacillus sp. CAU 1775]
MNGFVYLFGAIVFEIIGTTMLKLSDGFTVLLPSIAVAVFFGLSFYLFVFALKTIPLSLGYSIWSGLGTAGAALIGVLLFNEVLSGVNLIGLLIIIIGVIVMNLHKKPDTTSESTSS